MDISQFSTDDLMALKSGDLSRVSTDGLIRLRNMANPVDPATTNLDPRDYRAANPSPRDLLARAKLGDKEAHAEYMRLSRVASPFVGLVERGGEDAVLGLAQRAARLIPGTDAPANFVDSVVRSRADDMRKAQLMTGSSLLPTRIATGIGTGLTATAMLPTRGPVGAAGPMLPAPILTGARTMAGRAAQGGGVGALASQTAPIENAEDFARQNTVQTVVGAGLGALFTPVAELGISGANKLAELFRQQRPVISTAPLSVASSQATVSGAGTVTGKGGGYTFGTVGQDRSAGLTAEQRSLAKWWTEQGGKMTPGQASGSKALQQFEAKLESQPMTSGPFNEIKDANQELLNKIAAKALGQRANALDAPILGKVHDRLSDEFKRAADKFERPINPDDFLNTIGTIEQQYEGLLPSALADNPLVKRAINFAANGKATGEQLHELQSRLGKAALNEMTSPSGNRQVGMALYDVQEYMLDLLKSGMSKTAAAKFNEARSQYRTLMLLTGRTNVINPSTGNVNGVALASLLQGKDKTGFTFGKNNSELYDAARFAQAFKPIVGDSGTATRSALPGPTDFVLSLPFNLTTRAYLSQPSQSMLRGMTAAQQRGLLSSGPYDDLFPVSPLLGLAPTMGVMAAQGN